MALKSKSRIKPNGKAHRNGRQAGPVTAPSASLYRHVDPGQRSRAMSFFPANADSRQDITSYTHQRLLAMGRLLFVNVGFVRGVIAEIANYTVGNGWQPQFMGNNADWGALASERLSSWCRISDIRGQPFDWQTDLWLSIIAALRDGDVLMVLTASERGYPKIQFIPAHRLTSRGLSAVESGEYRGSACYNGVIYDRLGAVVAYQVRVDNESKNDVFIPANSAHLIFAPEWCDQGRGLTALSSVIHDHVDIDDITACEKFAAKLFASQTLVESVESDGEEGIGADFLETGTRGVDGKLYEDFDGGMVRKYRANSGQSIKAFEQDRPSPNLMQFRRELMRGTYSALGWPMEFAYDSKELNGTATRMVLSKVMRTTEKMQQMIFPAALKAVRFALSRFIRMGFLPEDAEWFKWAFQMPKRPTIDMGREAQQNREDFKLGLKTAEDIYGEQGLEWKAQIDQRVAEAKYIAEKCAAEGVDKRDVMLLTPNEQKDGAQNGGKTE